MRYTIKKQSVVTSLLISVVLVGGSGCVQLRNPSTTRRDDSLRSVGDVKKELESVAYSWLQSEGFDVVYVDVLSVTYEVSVRARNEEEFKKALELPVDSVYIKCLFNFTNNIPCSPTIHDELRYISISTDSELVLPNLSGVSLETLSVSQSKGSGVCIKGLAGASIKRLSLDFSCSVYPVDALSQIECEYLNISNLDITTFEPLRDLKLIHLVAYNTKVSSVAPLSKMTSLETLDVANTLVKDISPLAELSLIGLDVSHTLVTSFPQFPTNSFHDLSINNTLITNINTLAFTRVSELDMSHTSICDLRPLANTQISKLSANDSLIDNIDALSGSQIQILDISGTNVKDLGPLSSCSQLWLLTLNNTSVSSLDALSSIQGLKYISLKNTDITDITPLGNLMLREIDLDFDKIKKGQEVLSQSKTLKRINDMPAETFLRENMKQASENGPE